MSEFNYHDLERAAAAFVLEDETWPMFLEWMEANRTSHAAREFVASPDLAGMRREWIRHSPVPGIREARGSA